MEADELDSILESALDDFDEDDESKSAKPKEQKQETSSASATSASDPVKSEKDEKKEETPSNEEVTKLMENLLASGDFNKTLEELTSKFGGDLKEEDLPDLGDINLNNINEESLEKMLNEFQNKPEMQKMVEEMMGAFMSKDMMYEPMKEMHQRFPKWLEENKGKVSNADYEKYSKQHVCVKKMVAIYETEENIPQLIALMQEMQEYGQPPADMMKELSNGMAEGLDFEQLGLGSDKGCSIM
eukprot:TRINITY_DN3589_c0_g1_i1.p1 TRINITY_DN3589_c0_g1~~TRINITY_DN3589_c0_g1_i1.p1  ORF type:complete len:250 (+),score=82.14 TRINITY_DN3589_c0_g1_i1:25-750(+)